MSGPQSPLPGHNSATDCESASRNSHSEGTADPDTAAGQGTARAEVLAAHTPACSGPSHAQFNGHRCGPIYCIQCSEAAHDWVTWTPEHVAAALDAALAPAESADPDARLAALAEHIAWLTEQQHYRCAYGTREGDGRFCDCKFGGLHAPGGEATGCPEFRQAIWGLRAALGDPAATPAKVRADALREWIAEWPTTTGDGTFLATVARDGLDRADRIEADQ